MLISVVDTALQSAGQVIDASQAIRDRITDLSALDDLPGRDALTADCERSYDLLVAANDALTGTARAARYNVENEVKAK